MKIINTYGKNGRNFMNKVLADKPRFFEHDAQRGRFKVALLGEEDRLYEVQLTHEEMAALLMKSPAAWLADRLGPNDAAQWMRVVGKLFAPGKKQEG